ncbi:MFS family permease [Variovorax boronicumulans]|uniref:MFS family permease n=1 Tax=Variovorax boronicumulans TaxID=436515 RepID=A0AAW8E2V6_9BURK|nr:MFS transporter [Variovorax boronicumulans]MDP9881184.1 MFS family permease [Variovorax boronicumulans]MDP9926471.1 MFS family permease [Variovorax boronicumulans]
MSAAPPLSPAAPARSTDLDSRHAAMALGLSLPADVVLYLLLPMYASQFGVSLAEVGLLLAANRLVRIAGYGWVARFYARHGDRASCTLAVVAAACCGLGYATLSGFWALLPLRLTWGLCFAALNLSTQALATADPIGAARRSGRSRAFIATGPVLALPLGALLAYTVGPRAIFGVLAVVSLLALFVTRRLPSKPHHSAAPTRRFSRPNALDGWSFIEGLALDGLFIVGLSYLGKDLLPGGAVIVAGVLMALRYLAEIFLGPVGGRMAEHFGAERLLVSLSLVTSLALVGFGLGWLWSCAALIVVLRALQLPLLPPIVARRTPGPERVRALAARAVWRDIGAGAGPLLAGVLLPIASPPWIYGSAALLLAVAALACVRRASPPTPIQENITP